MLNPAEAAALIAQHLPAFGPEEVPLELARGRILAAAIRADRDFPPFDRVTMDGYALRAAELANFPAGAPRRFRVRGLQAAGDPAPPLPEEDRLVREIMTGACLPPNADSVLPYEDATRGEGDALTIAEQAVPGFRAGQYVHPRASDHRAGEVLLPAGTRLDGRALGIAATCGAGRVAVCRLPRLAVVATGDELVPVTAIPAPQQLRRSNDVALAAALAAAGFPPAAPLHFPDDPAALAAGLARLLAETEVLVLTGGVSRGRFDFLPAVLPAGGVREIFHRVAQRPGKPLWFGVAGNGTLVFALPGNPVSAYTCLHRYVLPALRRASGEPAATLRPARLPLAAEVAGLPRLAAFVPVQILPDGDQAGQAVPQPTNTSGDFSGLLGSAGFVELPARGGNFPAGWAADFYPWS